MPEPGTGNKFGAGPYIVEPLRGGERNDAVLGGVENQAAVRQGRQEDVQIPRRDRLGR